MSDERPETYIEQAKKIMDRLEACVDEHYAACALTPLYEDADVVTKLEYMLRVLAANWREENVELPDYVERLRESEGRVFDFVNGTHERAEDALRTLEWIVRGGDDGVHALRAANHEDAEILRAAQRDVALLDDPRVQAALRRAEVASNPFEIKSK